jgi:RND family efflux transporter MFP subunit
MRILLIISALIVFYACSNDKNSVDQQIEKKQFVSEKNPVDIIILKKSDFRKELVSNGKLKAKNKSILKFNSGDELLQLNVANGDRVSSGQVIAVLNKERSAQQLQQAKASFEKARFELQNVLIGQNYSLDDSNSIPKKVYNMACIQSGFTSAKSQLESAKLEYASKELKAPYSGIIASIKYKLYEQVGGGTEFCTLIDNSSFEVEFPVLESELPDISRGKEVKIMPFSMENKVFKGRITEINPIVDENGMIQVKAIVDQSSSLLDGMNVRVLVENAVSNQLVVPKAAVVLRDNQHVLFRIIGGKAYWTYVETTAENSDSYSVIANQDKGATLDAGDTVIVSGNLNLAHESSIEVK